MYVSGNASSFAVLSAARYAVFDRYSKKADEAYWSSSSAPICLKTLSRVLQASNNVQALSTPEIVIPKVSLLINLKVSNFKHSTVVVFR